MFIQLALMGYLLYCGSLGPNLQHVQGMPLSVLGEHSVTTTTISHKRTEGTEF